jgi:Icc-related predicted phosphoesterase
MIACGLSVFNHLFIIRKYAASRSDAMKILLISDIHANIYALHAVEQAEKSWDEVWCCGDVHVTQYVTKTRKTALRKAAKEYFY